VPNQAKLEQQERELHELIAPHVEGELLAVTRVQTGGFLASGQKLYGGLLGALMPRLRKEEGGLPLNALLALTADHVYVFSSGTKKGVQPPLRRWSRATLSDVRTQKWGKGLRVFMTLESGKKAIFMVLASGELRDRVNTIVTGAPVGQGTEPSPGRATSRAAACDCPSR
jgi:hypothetical protein